MEKKHKKHQRIVFGIFIILLILVVLFIVFGNPQTIFPRSSNFNLFGASQISETNDYYLYNLKATTNNPSTRSDLCSEGGEISIPFNQRIDWSSGQNNLEDTDVFTLSLPFDIQFEKEITTTDLTLSGVVALYDPGGYPSCNRLSIQPNIRDFKAVCNAVHKTYIRCYVSGEYYLENGAPLTLYGTPFISINLKLLKEGVINYITIYRFENNQCSQLTINSEEKTSNDYDNLEQCELKIIIPIEEPNISEEPEQTINDSPMLPEIIDEESPIETTQEEFKTENLIGKIKLIFQAIWNGVKNIFKF